MAQTITVAGIQTFTAAELLTLTEHAIAHLMVGGQSYSINGRAFMRADLNELREMRNALKTEVEEAGAVTGSLTALAELNRAAS